ncbi:hypothetical protein GQ607_017687 [Colletotrichum asianum]|uniref:Uncharacterized protein n=1 Tax=Colletotrichum asianum TaxID=702518 RepID=A0A8H3VRE5_9PEZI|nr:hypothetical protein GQ607_017687 [Colletotrichum asianum]
MYFNSNKLVLYIINSATSFNIA